MTRIALLSDTHAYWDERYAKYFAECDEIWHAGDIGSLELANRLQDIRPLKAVHGNIDGGELRRIYPETLTWQCEEAKIMMTHIGGYPGKYDPRIRKQLYATMPDLFISGHSHILKVQYDPTLSCLHINPGAAGLQGWQTVRTLVRFTIDGKQFKDLEVIELYADPKTLPLTPPQGRGVVTTYLCPHQRNIILPPLVGGYGEGSPLTRINHDWHHS